MSPARYLLALLTALLPALSAAGQSKINQRLKHELDSINVIDQRYRVLLMGGPAMQPRTDSLARAAGIAPGQAGFYIGQQMVAQDSINIRRIAQIIRQYGYPGKTLVGTPTNEVALLVIQHSTRIPQYLPLVKAMADRREVDFSLYARMLDRHLMWQGKPQLYGTQGRSYGIRNAQGQPETISFIWPIEDAAHVNKRRQKAGFDSTVEANAQRLGIPYKPITMEEVRRIEQQAAEASH